MNKGPKTPAKGTTRFRVSQSRDHFAEKSRQKNHAASQSTPQSTADENLLGCLLSHNWILSGCAWLYTPVLSSLPFRHWNSPQRKTDQ
jgi:hypothetical protein